MTHSELVEVAVRWLRGARRCGVVLVEPTGGSHEIPDAIGWSRGGRMSVVVECKTSRADFLRDKQKWHRKNDLGVGQQRFFMAPAGMLSADEVPAGWGLVEVHPSGICRVRVKLPPLRVYDREVWIRERGMLYCALVAVQGDTALFCGISGGRVLGKVRMPDGTTRSSCAACIRKKRACPTGLSDPAASLAT